MDIVSYPYNVHLCDINVTVGTPNSEIILNGQQFDLIGISESFMWKKPEVLRGMTEDNPQGIAQVGPGARG